MWITVTYRDEFGNKPVKMFDGGPVFVRDVLPPRITIESHVLWLNGKRTDEHIECVDNDRVTAAPKPKNETTECVDGDRVDAVPRI